MTSNTVFNNPSARHPRLFPNGKRFAFTILDDTDVATVDNIKPIYDLLFQCGMRTTKTIWPLRCEEGSKNFKTSQTMEDPDYREFVIELHRRGFEITWHGATMESSRRERTVAALEQFRATLGDYPRIHVNHSHNRENIYWGAGRIDSPLLKRLIGSFAGQPDSYFSGHDETSSYWWGDLCRRSIVYARNLTFHEINTTSVNPSMPYRDPRRPLAPWWFSASDAEGVSEFNDLLSTANQQRLEEEGGVCIVATHLGKGFVRNGVLNEQTRQRIAQLSQRPGWFPTVGQLLDWLRLQRQSDLLPPAEWRRMQWRWARDLALRKWSPDRTRRRRENGEFGFSDNTTTLRNS